MSRGERWLHAFGHALAAHALYGPGHQARREASTRLHGALLELLRADARPIFTFLDDAVIYQTMPVHGLRDWSWARRLGGAGIRRIEFSREATPDGVAEFLTLLHQRLTSAEPEEPLPRWPGIEAGDVSVEADAAPRASAATAPPMGVIALDEELAAMRYVCEQVAAGGQLPIQEVMGVVRALSLALRSEGELLIPLIPERRPDDQQPRHAVNSAVLAMAFGEWLGAGAEAIRSIGRAALLHDIGMSRVSGDVFRVQALTEAGRAGVARHPEDGARLLAQSPDLDLAAITAYEHHLGMDGTGYPVRRLHPAPHYVSRVVAVCGGYDALRSERCYRPARDHAAALAEIAAARGSAYDAGVAGSFVEMMTKWGGRMVEGRAEA